MSISDDLKKLWVSNKGDGVEVNTLEFKHSTWSIYRITDYHKRHTARQESGSIVIYEDIPMELTIPDANLSTQQEMTVNIDSLDGFFYSLIKDFTASNKETPISVVHRIYLDNDFNTVAINPPPKYVVTKATVRSKVITLQMSSTGFPQQLSGAYYTKNKFRGLIT